MASFYKYCYQAAEEQNTTTTLTEYINKTLMEKIQMEKKLGNCQCAAKNPKGKWCLSDVRQVVDKLRGNS